MHSGFDSDSDDERKAKLAPGASGFSDSDEHDQDYDGAETPASGKSISLDSPARSPVEPTNFAAVLEGRRRGVPADFHDFDSADADADAVAGHSISLDSPARSPVGARVPTLSLPDRRRGVPADFYEQDHEDDDEDAIPSQSISLDSPARSPQVTNFSAVLEERRRGVPSNFLEQTYDDEDTASSHSIPLDASTRSPLASTNFAAALQERRRGVPADFNEEDDDADTGSARSIPLDTPARSPLAPTNFAAALGGVPTDKDNDTGSERSISLDSPGHSPAGATNFLANLRQQPAPESAPSSLHPQDDHVDESERTPVKESEHEDDSQEVSIQLESPPGTALPAVNPKHASVESTSAYTVSAVSDHTSDTDARSVYTDNVDEHSAYTDEVEVDLRDSPISSIAPSIVPGAPKPTAPAIDTQTRDLHEEEIDTITFAPNPNPPPVAASIPIPVSEPNSAAIATPESATYPPRPPFEARESRMSLFSNSTESSSVSKKARPESMIMGPKGPLVLGLALVDFNHLVGPKIEFSEGSIFDDEEVAKILPFLALPDGAHLVCLAFLIY
jgi:hypothetical protein